SRSGARTPSGPAWTRMFRRFRAAWTTPAACSPATARPAAAASPSRAAPSGAARSASSRVAASGTSAVTSAPRYASPPSTRAASTSAAATPRRRASTVSASSRSGRGRSPRYVSRTRRAARPPRRQMRPTAGPRAPARRERRDDEVPEARADAPRVQQRGQRRRLRVEFFDRGGERRDAGRHQARRELGGAGAALHELGREAGPQAKPCAGTERQADRRAPEPQRRPEGDHLLRDPIGARGGRLHRARDGRRERRLDRLVLLDEEE